MDAILRQIDDEQRQHEEAKRRHENELRVLLGDISAARERERKAKREAAEIDELRTRARNAFTAEHKRLCAAAKSERERARQLQDRYDELSAKYADEDSRQPRTFADIVGEVAEERVLELLKQLQSKGGE